MTPGCRSFCSAHQASYVAADYRVKDVGGGHLRSSEVQSNIGAGLLCIHSDSISARLSSAQYYTSSRPDVKELAVGFRLPCMQ